MEKSGRSGFGFGVCILAALGATSMGCAETARKPPAMTQLLAAPDEAVGPDGAVVTKRATPSKQAAQPAPGDDDAYWWRADWRR